MNTKSYLLTGLLLATTYYTANNNDRANYNVLKIQHYVYRNQSDIYDSLASPDCGSPTQLALDSTPNYDVPMQSQASVLGLSGLRSYAFSSTHTSELLDTMVDADMPLVEVDAHDHTPESTSSVKIHKLVTIAGSQEEVLDYQAYSTQKEPRLDIWVSDTVLNNINTYGAKKLGMKLAPSGNMLHIHNKADFQFMTLLLSLGGDDGWNFIYIPNCNQKKQTFNAGAWLSCTGELRAIACDYLDAYQDNEDNATLFAQSQQHMPGATALLLDSYRRFHPDMSNKPDDVVRYAICQTIKHETKNLWLAKVGQKIGF